MGDDGNTLLEAGWLGLSQEPIGDEGNYRLIFDVYFNHDLTPCDPKDSGIDTYVYMGASDTFDIGKPLPEGRNGRTYAGDYLHNVDPDRWMILN